MKKKLLLLTALVLSLGLGACDTTEMYTPTHGGVVDTLHNEIHVENLDSLLSLESDPKQGKYAKDESKVYITDDDSLRYKWNGSEYVIVSETNTTINFYFDNTQTTDEDGADAPIFTFHWYLLKPLGTIPDEVDSLTKILALGHDLGFEPSEQFPTFIGFSAYPTCLDENKLWNYETDYRQQAVTNLYGIWVCD